MDEPRLRQLLDRFPQVHVLVVGDYFLDKYLDLDRRLSETSLETGLEAYQAVGVRCSPGAAGTVVNNLRALDVQVSALGVIGDDGEGYELRRGLAARGVHTDPLIVHPERFTPTYLKPMMHEPDDRRHELNRVDTKNRSPLPEAVEEELVERLRAAADRVHGIVVSDQVPEANCGAITGRVRTALSELGRSRPELVIAVDSREHIGLFQDVILKPNAREAMRAAGEGTRMNVEKEAGISPHPILEDRIERAEVEAAGLALFRRTGRPVFVTIGAEGILVFTADGMRHAAGVRVSGPLDIVGAGDSVMAGIVASLCARAAPDEAALVGNLVASITVQQIGTTGTASRGQVMERFRTDGRGLGG